MGYTHYWTLKKAKRGQSAQLEKDYQRAILDCAKIVKAYYKANGGLSGYTAHTPLPFSVGAYGGLEVNGKGDDAHEPFVLREHFSQNLERDGFSFCKTARKPYDAVVTACLIVLKYHLGDNIDVSSDGNCCDWVEGLELAKRVLKKKTLEIPITITRESEESYG